MHLIIEPGRAAAHYWRDLWRYRELMSFLAWRDIAVRYKQTAIGVLWAVIRPGMTVSQAITEAGGVSERGSTRGITITRKDAKGRQVEIDAKMSDLVRPDDEIKVRQRRI